MVSVEICKCVNMLAGDESFDVLTGLKSDIK